MKYATLPLLLSLAACGTPLSQARTGGDTAPGPDTCGAAAYQNLIGQDAAQALIVPEPKRVYGPEDAVTADFLANRVNVQLDNTDTIVAVVCG
ncbi:I78 family peptidase inhibitor [Sulfitobacter sp. S190]|uniref:I78 family peptidase inhibitor n=1 Tax=Sulfitobacter sp. S190 TaxID=2867022 RepID=UPI0021A64862|nr:I78 family peptidase inhibitor [Sulfitobacter sp. S190]UWR22285.1 hypothetical protein K3756_16700 [Sulfitobacter sp. S190]